MSLGLPLKANVRHVFRQRRYRPDRGGLVN
jgi:hypothetical protein